MDINKKAREFINLEEIKEELDAPTRMWLEYYIIELLVDVVSELTNTKHKQS